MAFLHHGGLSHYMGRVDKDEKDINNFNDVTHQGRKKTFICLLLKKLAFIFIYL